MASNPPGPCCLVGVKHEGETTGSIIKIDNKIDAYVAEPSGKNIHKDAAILIVPDIFGIWKNSQLIADQFASNGYYTILPDFFNGDAVPVERPANFDLFAWIKSGSSGDNPHTPKDIDAVVEASIKYLHGKGIKKIGGVGYCFGGKYVVRFMPKGKGIDVGYSAHPSFVDEEELAAISGPFSIAAAETDTIFPAEKRHKSEIILTGTKQPYQINLFSGVEHGFAVRGDMSLPVVKFSKEQAFLQAVAWFNQWLI